MNNFYHIIAELSHSFLLIEIINCFQRNLLFQLTNEIIAAHNLKSEETFSLIEFSLKNETMSFNGTKLDAIIPPISIFGGRAKKKQLLLERLPEYYDKYSGIVIFLRGDNYA